LNISKYEQRTLHALARGGRIEQHKDDRGDITAVDCITREGWRLDDCTLSSASCANAASSAARTAPPTASPARVWKR